MRKMSIYDFARWAIRDELPKSQVRLPDFGRPAGIGAATAGFELLASIDYGSRKPDIINEFGLVAFPLGGEVHPDARIFAEVLSELECLADIEITIPQAVLFGLDIEAHRDITDPDGEAKRLVEMALVDAFGRATVIDANGRHMPRRGIWGLVTQGAMSRDGLSWEVEPMRLDFVRKGGFARWFRMTGDQIGDLGAVRAHEVDGFNHACRRPFPDAYHKTSLSPEPTGCLIDRIEWIMHRSILNHAADRLAGRLIEHHVHMAGDSDTPWCDGASKPRIWVARPIAETPATNQPKKKRRAA